VAAEGARNTAAQYHETKKIPQPALQVHLQKNADTLLYIYVYLVVPKITLLALACAVRWRNMSTQAVGALRVAFPTSLHTVQYICVCGMGPAAQDYKGIRALLVPPPQLDSDISRELTHTVKSSHQITLDIRAQLSLQHPAPQSRKSLKPKHRSLQSHTSLKPNP
jgi:hypothetical protein